MSLPSLQFLLKNQLITLWESPCTLLVVFPLLLLFFFPLLLLISSSFNCGHLDYSASWCILWVYPVWNSCFLDLGDRFLSQVRDVFSYYLFKYFLRPFHSLLILTPL